PLGPRGVGNVQSCSATFGLSRFATAHALGGFMMSAHFPAMSALLFEALSHPKTSGGKEAVSFLMYSSTSFTASERTVTLPLASTNSAPYELQSAPGVSTECPV